MLHHHQPLTSSFLHVVSWNVAGWSTTAAAIAKQHKSVSQYLARHRVDVLCLQETEISRDKLLSKPQDFAVPGYRSFWAPCLLEGRGLNGVATFVREPLGGVAGSVRGFDPAAFGIKSLDDEGRCLVTIINDIAIVNVYVPYDGENQKRFGYKLEFLAQLKKLIVRLQSESKLRVILAGDLNLKARKEDVIFSMRYVDLAKLQQYRPVQPFASAPLDKLMTDMQNGLLADFENIFSRREIVELPSGRFQLKVPTAPGSSGRSKTTIPGSFVTREEAEFVSDLGARISPDGHMYRRPKMVMVELFFEILRRSFGQEFDEKCMREFSDRFGEPRCPEQTTQWLAELQQDSQLVDSFLKFHADAIDRFTCFDQYKNYRYCNKGARIDFILVQDTIPVALGAPLPLVNVDAQSALACVTAEGRWRPAPMDGSGLLGVAGLESAGNPSSFDWEFQCSDPPRTGIIYTPPSFSDHLAVTALVDFSFKPDEASHTSAYVLQCAERMQKHEVFSGQVALVGALPGNRQQTLTGMFKRKVESSSEDLSAKRRPNPNASDL